MRDRAPILIGIAVLVGLVGTSCGSDARSTSSAVVDLSGKNFRLETSQRDVEVGALDNQFTPPYVEVKRGTTVTFENDGRNPHDIYPADEGAFTPVEPDAFQPGASATISFDEVGDFPFYCSLHGTPTAGMVGAIRVVE